MIINNFIDSLRKSINQKLPAFEAHKLMMPEQRLKDFEKIKPNNTTRKSAVLLLISKKNNDWVLTLIKRQKYDGVHSGQIALPGGKTEKTDKSLIDTALRESEEEIGINPEKIEIIGKLSELYIPPSNFLVQPVIGYSKENLNYNIDNHEVEKVFEISIKELLSANPFHDFDFEVKNNIKIKAPCYIFGEHKIWGATSMILCELKEILKNYNDLAN